MTMSMSLRTECSRYSLQTSISAASPTTALRNCSITRFSTRDLGWHPWCALSAGRCAAKDRSPWRTAAWDFGPALIAIESFVQSGTIIRPSAPRSNRTSVGPYPLNRKLAADDEVLKATRGERAQQDLGEYYVVDVNRNAVVRKDVD